jgi:hypothetical protein
MSIKRTRIREITHYTNRQRAKRFANTLAPTAAFVSISGRVITPQELGLNNTLVTLTDTNGESRTVMTGKSGSFRFTDVAAGETYILTVTSKRYTYSPQVITANEDITELRFHLINNIDR